MLHKRSFSYVFGGPVNACTAAAVLLSHESQYNIADLWEGDAESQDVQCEPVHTGDVTSVRIKRLTAHYFEVRVEVEFEADEHIAFSPYSFNGEYDLPKMTTYLAPDEDTNPHRWYPSKDGEPYAWGEEV